MSDWHPVSRPPRWFAWMPGWLRFLLRWAIRFGLLGVLVGFVLGIFYYVKASRYDLDAVAELPAPNTFFARDGRPLDADGGPGTGLATRDELPEFLVRCLEAREDARFYHHPGIDPRGLVRATWRNLRDWEFAEGASTLTMQLARNTYDIREMSLHRKFLEIALTLRIESRYSKDEILIHYLNRIYFGSGCHGIAEASRTYFDKAVADLHRGEAALLVGIIRGPHIFSPFRDLEAARAQQKEVLERMIDMGRLTPAEVREIRALPIEPVPPEARGGDRSYALHAVERELSFLRVATDIRRDGLRVETTLDPGWQLRLETELSEAVRAAESAPGWSRPTHRDHTAGAPTTDYLQYAAVTLEFDSGEVLAHIGGRDFLDSRHDRAIRARRDLGAVFEPWIAAAAAERGKRILAGKPVLTGRQLGPGETARLARRCGLGGPFLDTEDLFRGSAAATPMETATALATLAHRGRRPDPHFITRILAPDGTELFRREPTTSQAITAHAAEQALGLFRSVGTSQCFRGTTGSKHDAWILRVGPTGATAIWFGFDQSRRIADSKRLETLLDRVATSLAQ